MCRPACGHFNGRCATLWLVVHCCFNGPQPQSLAARFLISTQTRKIITLPHVNYFHKHNTRGFPACISDLLFLLSVKGFAVLGHWGDQKSAESFPPAVKPSLGGEPVQNTSVNFLKHCRKASLLAFTPKDLRHTFELSEVHHYKIHQESELPGIGNG